MESAIYLIVIIKKMAFDEKPMEGSRQALL